MLYFIEAIKKMIMHFIAILSFSFSSLIVSTDNKIVVKLQVCMQNVRPLKCKFCTMSLSYEKKIIEHCVQFGIHT